MAQIKIKIRSHVSQAFGVLIPAGKWEQYLNMLDKDGHPNRRELLTLILIFSRHIEDLETHIEDLYFKFALQEDKSAVFPTEPEIQLRTVASITAELEQTKTDTTTCFYVSADDWKILAANVNKELAKNNPAYGYGKEVDPKDYKEKVCLYCMDLPVFKE